MGIVKNKIVSRFYLITLDNKNIYVGYTNRPIKERFREHVKDKELPKEARVKQIDKLEFEFTWDMVQVNENAKRVSKRENELIAEYRTSSSFYQKGLRDNLGGQTWASVKAFVHSNKDNPQYRGMDSQELLAYLDRYRKRMGKLSNFIGKYRDIRLDKLNHFITNYKDPRLTNLHNLITRYRDYRLEKLQGFVSRYHDYQITKLSNFITHYKSYKLDKLHTFISNYKDTSYRDPGLNKLSHFVSDYKDYRIKKLSNFISHYQECRVQKLSNFIGNYKNK